MTTLLETALTFCAGMAVPILVGSCILWHERRKAMNTGKPADYPYAQPYALQPEEKLKWITYEQALTFLKSKQGYEMFCANFYRQGIQTKEVEKTTLYCVQDIEQLVVKNQSLSLEDAMRELDLDYDCVKQLEKYKNIKSVKVLGENRYTKESIKEYLEAKKANTTSSI